MPLRELLGGLVAKAGRVLGSRGAGQPPFGSSGSITYHLNNLAYTSLSQPAFMSDEFVVSAEDGRPVYPQDQCETWDTRELRPGEATEHPVVPGLFFIRAALSSKQCSEALHIIDGLTNGGAIQGKNGAALQPSVADEVEKEEEEQQQKEARALKIWEWFEYERARWMVPLQPSSGVSPSFAPVLRTLHSHGCTDPTTWPLLSALEGGGGAALRRIEGLPLSRVAAFAGRPALFMQVQALECGAPITAHVDEAEVGGRAIATAVLQGSSEVRVGGVSFECGVGDMYALSGHARDDVDHEVYASRHDRISVTTRYGSARVESSL